MDSMILVLQIAILLMSVVVHEVSHGAMANYLGDPTAKYAGRLSLNPIKHLDFFGSFIFPLLLLLISGGKFAFGWAKPVPYNPHNLRNQKWGPALVAGAGPGANLAVALAFGFPLRFIPFWESAYLYNLGYIFSIIVFINILLAIFNLVPIPPLDGSKILFSAIPYRYENVKVFLERYGLFLLIFFIFFLFQWILPLIFWIYQLIVGKGLLLF